VVVCSPPVAKHIFVTGGVVSSLGKGLLSASLAALLQARGYACRIRKFAPYLTVDPGPMSPDQPGEVYRTAARAEAQAQTAKAAQLIAETGYHRRDPELAELELAELTDPQGIRFWPEPSGRDGCRTPMVWGASRPNADPCPRETPTAACAVPAVCPAPWPGPILHAAATAVRRCWRRARSALWMRSPHKSPQAGDRALFR